MKKIRFFLLLASFGMSFFESSFTFFPLASAGLTHSGNSENTLSLSDAKPLPSFKILFLKLSGVVVIAMLGVWALSKLKAGTQRPGLVGNVVRQFNHQLNRVTQGSNSNKMIQILASQNLNPKQSLVVVRVLGRTLVLGLSPDSMSLMTQFNAEENSELGLEDDLTLSQNSNSAGEFKRVLTEEGFKPKSSPTSAFASSGSDRNASLVPNVRNRVKSRLEGLKPL